MSAAFLCAFFAGLEMSAAFLCAFFAGLEGFAWRKPAFGASEGEKASSMLLAASSAGVLEDESPRRFAISEAGSETMSPEEDGASSDELAGSGDSEAAGPAVGGVPAFAWPMSFGTSASLTSACLATAKPTCGPRAMLARAFDG